MEEGNAGDYTLADIDDVSAFALYFEIFLYTTATICATIDVTIPSIKITGFFPFCFYWYWS